MGRVRHKGRPIHGWLCLDKPAGMTSTAAVGSVRRITSAQKAGHGGTLDPLATGVLPIALGEATKTVAYVMDGLKHYSFTARWGKSRSTDDAEGDVLATSARRPSAAEIAASLPEFVGMVAQVPPRFAAIKIEGERAYDRARRGEAVELGARTVRIDSFTLIDTPDADHAIFDLVCGRATYVRALIRDLGERLGCLGHVVALRRLACGPFRAEASISLAALEQLVADDALPQALMPVSVALGELPALALTEPQAHRLCAGQTIRIAPGLIMGEAGDDATVRAMTAGQVVALARLQGVELSPLRVFHL